MPVVFSNLYQLLLIPFAAIESEWEWTLLLLFSGIWIYHPRERTIQIISGL